MTFRRLAAAITLLVCATAASAQETPRSEASLPSGHFTYTFGLDYMLQVSGRRDYPFHDATFTDDETFAWWRLRPRFGAKSRYLDFAVEGQDTHAAGGSFGPRKAWLDLLNAYVDVKTTNGMVVRLGRQQADFEVLGRMVRTSDFVAVIRSFDVAQASWRNRTSDVRVSVMKPVDNLPASFNREKKGELLWTAYGKHTIAPRAALQSYVIARHNDDVTGESGSTGNGAVYAWLLQADGPTPVRRIDWTAETVIERGHYAADKVRAWAVFLRSEADLGNGSTIDVRYSATSGDKARGDGVRGQYDTFYGSASYFGALGQLRGSNLQSLSIGGAVRISNPVTLNWRYFNTHLNDRRDVWYGVFTPNIFNPEATSSFLGQEVASLLSWQATPRLTIRGGYFRFFPGSYPAAAQGSPYELRLQIIGRL